MTTEHLQHWFHLQEDGAVNTTMLTMNKKCPFRSLFYTCPEGVLAQQIKLFQQVTFISQISYFPENCQIYSKQYIFSYQ